MIRILTFMLIFGKAMPRAQPLRIAALAGNLPDRARELNGENVRLR